MRIRVFTSKLVSLFLIFSFFPLINVKAAASVISVSTANELVNALEDPDIQQINFENNIIIDQRYQEMQIAGTTKIINGNGFSFTTQNMKLLSGPGLQFIHLKDSLINIDSAGSISVENVTNSSIKLFRFTNTFTIKNSQLVDSLMDGSEELKIYDSILNKSSITKPLLSPLILSNVTFNNSSLGVYSWDSKLENVKMTYSKDAVTSPTTPLTIAAESVSIKNLLIDTDTEKGMLIQKGSVLLEGDTTINGPTQTGISLDKGNLYVKGKIAQTGNAYTIETTRENVFTTQVHDLYGNLKKYRDQNLNSYYNTADRDGEEPVLADGEELFPTELDPVTFLKQDYTEITGQTDRQDLSIFVKDGKGESKRTRPDRYGEFSFTLTDQPAGSTIYVYAFSPDGNQSKVQKFTVPASQPAVPIYVSSIYNSDKEVSGKTAANAEVFVKKDGVVIGKDAADTQGFFEFKLNSLNVKTNLEVYAQDKKGRKSAVLKKIVDSPFIYTDNMKSETAITGSVTSSTPIKLEALVKGKSVGTATAKKGNPFRINIPKLSPGTAMEVTGYDDERKIKKIVNIKDLTPPAKPSINPVSDQSTSIYGKTEPNAKVKLYIKGSYQKEVKADKYGKYTFTISKQKAGTEIKIIAFDLANNTSQSVIKVIDKTPPKIPTVNKVTYKSKTITGKAEKGSTIYVYRGKQSLGKAVVSSKGNFKVKIKAQKKRSTLTIYAIDKAKNKSKNKYVRVL